ncbi:hypothetical protein HDU81_004986 [Chytriomyces hyalinus]|nr:hypothetical protein HDU81_004986 [Chytriomyces hyalinus]
MRSFFEAALLTVALASAWSSAAGAVVSGHLVASDLLPETTVTPGTKVILDGGAYVAHVTADGSFSFPDVSDGSHLIEIMSREFMYPKVRVSVAGDDVLAHLHIDGTSWNSPGPVMNLPLEIPGRMKLDPFLPRPKMTIMGMIMGNPMLLMMGGTFVLFYYMPKLLEGMDPEELKKMEDNRKNQPKMEMPDISEGLANWFAPAPTQPAPKKK